MTQDATLPLTAQVFDHLWRAALGFAMAYAFWWFANPTWWMFYLYAGICAVGGGIRFAKCLFVCLQLIYHRRTLANYQAQGATPKADKIAREEDLKRGGLLR